MNSNEPDITRGQRAVRNPEVAFDETDLSARGVVFFLVFLGCSGIIILATTWGAYRYMVSRYVAGHQSSVVGLQREDAASMFPPPRLQPDPAADWNSFRWREHEILNAPEGLDPATGRKHIPIQQAIDQVAATGLPVLNASTELKIQHRDPETQRESK